MTSPWIAALVALLAWWGATGAILVAASVVGRARRPGEATVIFAVPLVLGGLWALMASLPQTGPAGAYLGFAAALLLWGAVELAFLTGVVTGPVRHPCPAGARGLDRFLRAWGTVAHHEILLALAIALILWASLGAPNQTALWTFGVLWFARVSAKLNLYLGVPRHHAEFLPARLAHLPSHFRHARLNWFFPVAVTAMTFATGCWLERLVMTGEVQFALLATLTALAALEHWLMVLPLPDEKLWRWMLPAPKTDPERG